MAERVSEVLLSIGSEFENIELIQAVLDESLQRLDFDEDSRYWIGIAVREAVANAIKHGNRQDPDKQVEVQLYVEAGHLVIRVRDQGEGFDPRGVANPLDPENLLKPDGRGIFYMNRFMDAIEYDFGPEGGTVVTLRKRLCASSVDSGRGEEEQG
jgi:serine/threonine-protein kinase RsbW